MRIRLCAAAVICLGALAAWTTPSHAADIVVTVNSADPTGVNVTPPRGIYQVTATGVYDYDTGSPGAQLADAECSTDSPLWDGVVDQVAHDYFGLGYPSLEPAPIGEWQRYRFVVRIPENPDLNDPFSPANWPFYSNDLTTNNQDALDISIGPILSVTHPNVEWVPLNATVVDRAGGVVVGCSTAAASADHQYVTAYFFDGTTHNIRVEDRRYVDNAGTLTVRLHQLA